MHRDGVRQELSPPDAFTLEGEEAGQLAEGIKRIDRGRNSVRENMEACMGETTSL